MRNLTQFNNITIFSGLRSSEILHGLGWRLVADVTGRFILCCPFNLPHGYYASTSTKAIKNLMIIIIIINLTKVRIYLIMIARNKYYSKVHYNKQYRTVGLSAKAIFSDLIKRRVLSPMLSHLRLYLIFLRPIRDLLLPVFGPPTLGQYLDLQPTPLRNWNSRQF
jgi:hypothetical protein